MSEDELTPQQAAALAMFDDRLKRLAERENAIIGRKNLWLAHHWPEHYAERCIKIGHRHVCRRCAALYPLGLLVAILTAAGLFPGLSASTRSPSGSCRYLPRSPTCGEATWALPVQAHGFR